MKPDVDSCDKLFKEWAIVCKALGDGRQIFVARKGGIAEERDEFVVENRRFFLFSSFAHQSREGLDKRYHLEFDLVRSEEPKNGQIRLRYFAEVTDEIRVTNRSTLERLKGLHIWNDSLLKDRFAWGSESLLTLVLLRVFELPKEIQIPMKKEYGGCKSWVTLERPIELPKGLRPVLNDELFLRNRKKLLSITSQQT